MGSEKKRKQRYVIGRSFSNMTQFGPSLKINENIFGPRAVSILSCKILERMGENGICILRKYQN